MDLAKYSKNKAMTTYRALAMNSVELIRKLSEVGTVAYFTIYA